MTGAALDDARRATLAALADVLLPGGAGMPAASEADVHGRWVDRVLTARPDLAEPLLRVLDGAAGAEPEREARRLHAEDGDGFGVLATVVTGAYYLSPKIRRLIGYPGQKRTPPLPDEADYYLDDGALLEPVRAMGPIYRPTPPEGGQ